MAGGLLERGRELGLVESALDTVVAGSGRLVVIEGVAGIGKSSLVAAAREAARPRGVAVLAARGSELERLYAFGVVRQLFEPSLSGMPVGVRDRVLAGAAALAAPVVLPDAAGGQLETDASFGTLHGLFWLAAGLAADRPLLLAVDDAHWTDEASLRFLLFLAQRLDDVRVLVLVAQRPEATGPAAGLRSEPTAELVRPSALSVAATSAVLAGQSDGPVAAEFAEACQTASGGNPLLLQRLADGLSARGIEFTAANARAVGRVGPETVADAVNATLTRLSPDASRLARAAAALRDETPLVTAAALAELTDARAAAAADELVGAGVLEDGRPMRFVHSLVRDAVEHSLSPGGRSALHGRAAGLLAAAGAPPEAVAVHLLHSEPGARAWVVDTLAAAARRALRSGAPEEALAALERALAEPPPHERRVELLLELAQAESRLGRGEALSHALDAHAAAGDEISRARAALALLSAGGPARLDAREYVALIEAAISSVAGRDRELILELEAARFSALFLSPALLASSLGDAERFAELDGSTPGESLVLVHVAAHRLGRGGSAAEVAEPVERAVAHADVVNSIGPGAPWFELVTVLLFKTDRLDVARRTLAVGLDAAQRRGSVAGFAAVSTWRGWVALRAGHAAAAEADARAAFDAVPSGAWQRVLCAAALIEVLIERGELGEAGAILEQLDGQGELPADRGANLLLAARSQLRAAGGDPAGALSDQLEARRREAVGLAVDPNMDGWLRIARLQHATGNTEAAVAEAEAALGAARRWDTPGYLGQAFCTLALVRGGDPVALLRNAVEQLERSPARLELARTLVELGAALRRRGDRVAAREPLRRALDLATTGGLVRVGERAREELRVSGARVRRPALAGVAALTPSEARIVERAATGVSNPEIAQALFVTVKTVEMHLSNAYRKLGISSRRELADQLAAAP